MNNLEQVFRESDLLINVNQNIHKNEDSWQAKAMFNVSTPLGVTGLEAEGGWAQTRDAALESLYARLKHEYPDVIGDWDEQDE